MSAKTSFNIDSTRTDFVQYIQQNKEYSLLRIIKSAFLWTTLLTAAYITFTVYALKGRLSASMTPFAPLVTGIGLAALGFIIYKYHQKLFYEFSLSRIVIQDFFGKYTWFHKIDPYVTLGAIPTYQKALKIMTSVPREKNKIAILSIVKKFEITESSLLAQPITTKDWEKFNVPHKFIQVNDLKPPTVRQIQQGITFIDEQKALGNHVYVHCKAGKGRSATVVACYDFHVNKDKYTAMNTQDVVNALVKNLFGKRSHIRLNASQKKGIYNYIKAERAGRTSTVSR